MWCPHSSLDLFIMYGGKTHFWNHHFKCLRDVFSKMPKATRNNRQEFGAFCYGFARQVVVMFGELQLTVVLQAPSCNLWTVGSEVITYK